MNDHTILMTGAAGFIGSNVLNHFFQRYPNYNFIVLDALTYAGDFRNISPEIVNAPNFRFVYGDILNIKVVENLVSKASVVIHFAAETHVTRSIYDDSLFFKTDVIGTQCVASAVLSNQKHIDKFIHISTSEVYGTALSEPMDESHPLKPQSPYAAAKVGADRLVEAYYMTYKIPAVIVRPFNMFGPHQHLEKVIPRFITSCILGEPLTIHGTGDSQRDFTYVDDLARALDLIVHASSEKVVGEIFNVGSGNSLAIKDIAALIFKIMLDTDSSRIKYNSFALNIGDRPGQVFKHIADINKMKEKLGWKPEISFEDGLRKTINWYIQNEEWWRSKLWMRCVQIQTAEGKIEKH